MYTINGTVNGLICAEVPLRIYSLTHSLVLCFNKQWLTQFTWKMAVNTEGGDTVSWNIM